jgi:excisionase family DNA binding protein
MEKTILNFNDLTNYTGLSKSYLYKLTSNGLLPAYKPFGKCLFFDKIEVDNWLKQNPIVNADATELKASTLVTLKAHNKAEGGLK